MGNVANTCVLVFCAAVVTACGRPTTMPAAALAEPKGRITVTKPLAWRVGVVRVVTRMPVVVAVLAVPVAVVAVEVVVAAVAGAAPVVVAGAAAAGA